MHAKKTPLVQQILGPGAHWSNWTPIWLVLSAWMLFVNVGRYAVTGRSTRRALVDDDIHEAEQWLSHARGSEADLLPPALAAVTIPDVRWIWQEEDGRWLDSMSLTR